MPTSLIGLLLAALCAALWSALDALRKRIGQDVSATGAVAGLHVAQLPWVVPLAVWAWAAPPDGSASELVRLVLGDGSAALGSAAYLKPALLSAAANIVANYLFLRAVQQSPLSLTIPYLSFTPVFTALLALATDAPAPNVWGWLGVGVVTVGAFALNPGRSEDGPLAPIKALSTERGSLYMLIVALLWSVTATADTAAAGASSVVAHTAFVAASTATAFVGLRAVKDRGLGTLWRELRPAWGLLGLGAMLLMLAIAVQLTAYNTIPTAYVEAIKRALGLLSAIGLGYVWFGERDGVRRKLIAVAVMSLGVALILLADRIPTLIQPS